MKYMNKALKYLVGILSILGLLVGCTKPSPPFTQEERETAERLAGSVHEPDSLLLLQKALEAKGDYLGSVVALREYGKLLRNASRFDEALKAHSKGLRQAETLGDTIEWVQALNNLGTDYRRLGVLDVAQSYHYQAWLLSNECKDTTSAAKKNSVISLNGLGNIYILIGNYSRADSVLRMALAEEKKLGSTLGMAINYANLGSIFEHQGEMDSAWIYYQLSMQYNQQSHSTLGISLCHTYFGSLYEQAGAYDKALEEYARAYELMKHSDDKWHALNSLIAMAGISHTMGQKAKMERYLSQAKEIAEHIKSKSHLADIYALYYKHYKQEGNYREALACHERREALQDSLLDIEKGNRILNAGLSIEHNRQEQQVEAMHQLMEIQRREDRIGYIALILALLLLGSVLAVLFYTLRVRSRRHQELKQLSLMRESFYTNITHEFRTPLTMILGLSHEVEQTEELPESVHHKMSVIQQQGNSLLTLINQLLDISKIKSVIGKADWVHGNITAYIGMIVDSYRDYAQNFHIDLQYKTTDEISMDFVPDYACKIMNNLLSNALKFTPAGGTILVKVNADGQRLHLYVRDTGKGIKPEALEHIFEPFYQEDHCSKINTPGTGIGLSLVKLILDNIDGTITTESKTGEGTTFHITIPIRHECKNNMTDNEEAHQKPLLPTYTKFPEDDKITDEQEHRILVIEDNPDVASYIGSQLSDHYTISYASDGRMGVEKAMDIVPDLIITDLMMPEVDGLEVCRSIRSNELTDHIPVIIVTAKANDVDRIEGLKVGADAYLTKPFNHDELQVRVQKLLEQRQKLREKFSQAIVEEKEQEECISDTDRRFIAKTVDTIYKLMNRQGLEITTLAEELCISPRQLHRKITALTGENPMTFMLRIRMRKAKQLIDTQPELALEQISEQCGFDGYSGFYQAFKKFYKVSPSTYKKLGKTQ